MDDVSIGSPNVVRASETQSFVKKPLSLALSRLRLTSLGNIEPFRKDLRVILLIVHLFAKILSGIRTTE